MTRWSVIFVLNVLALPSIAMGHPLKATASLVEYDPETKTLSMECKVFRDDFENSLANSALKDVDPEKLSKDDKKKIIESHFQKHYIISHNGRVMPLKLESSKYLRGHNVLVMKFAPHNVTLKKGDRIFIKNALFFEDFGYMQSNRVVVRIPPFSIDDHHVATLSNQQIAYAL